MKDLSDYIESILKGLIPNTVVDVHLTDGIYHICVDIYEVRYTKDMVRDLMTKYIHKELKTYFPNGLEHKKIVNVYETQYR